MNMRSASIIFALSTLCASAQGADGVKYRGLFINDEDWGLRPWAIQHFGKDEQIGVRAYEEVFFVMKRNGLNLLWPAMHEGGYEFSSRPENLELAKKHGIVVGTSHCEPMLRNNCYLSKEDKKKWSWVNNREFLIDYWREGVRRGTGNGERGTGNGDVLWTIGMRGIHDGRMPDGKTTQEKIKVLEEVFAAQCALLPEGAPKLFCPYKEVLPIFNAGLKVPKDATIMWTNDNFGYVRRIGAGSSNASEQSNNSNNQTIKQSTHQGIYWHLSYWGKPHGYIHLCTTPPAFMWYELVAKCWENGVRDVWMVNAGDVFQAEILLDAFGRFAADPEAWKTKNNPQQEAIDGWVREKFFSHKEHKEHKDGECLCELCVLCGRITSHLAEYYNLGFNRKPEHMCVQWTTNLPTTVKSDLLRRYHALLAEDLKIEDSLATLRDSASLRETYFRTVGFQAQFLAHAGIIHLEGRDKAYAHSVLDPLYERWDKLSGGKWSGFWIDTIDEKPGSYQPEGRNRWSSQMQWPWNEPEDPSKRDRRGVSRNDYHATAYRADVPEPVWLEPIANEAANGGAWKRVNGLGTSGRAHALLPVKPGVGVGATMEYGLDKCCQCENVANTTVANRQSELVVGTGNIGKNDNNLILQFLPDFALWPGLKLGVNVVFDDGTTKYAAVPRSDSNLGEADRIRNQAVQDNFIRVEVPVPALAKSVKIVAVDPGVVVDRVGVRSLSNTEKKGGVK